MKRVRLSPAERFVLGTASGLRERIALVHAARKELGEPGSVSNLPFGFWDMMRYVFLVGFNRQPVLFTLGPVIAVLSYVMVVFQFLSWFSGRFPVFFAILGL